MNVNKNSYTIGFACVMVVFVAALLASMSIRLTPLQDSVLDLLADFSSKVYNSAIL